MSTTPEKNAKRVRQLEIMVADVAERLAIAVTYLQSIDDVVDPFADPSVERAWIIAGLAARAKTDIFKGRMAFLPYAVDCSEIIKAVQNGAPLSLCDTQAYHEMLDLIRGAMRNGYESNSAELAGAAKTGIHSNGSGTVEPVREGTARPVRDN